MIHHTLYDELQKINEELNHLISDASVCNQLGSEWNDAKLGINFIIRVFGPKPDWTGFSDETIEIIEKSLERYPQILELTSVEQWIKSIYTRIPNLLNRLETWLEKSDLYQQKLRLLS